MKNEQYKETVNSLARHIQDAYAIVVGGRFRDVCSGWISPFL